MINDDASDWFASQGQEIQEYEAPEMPEAEEPETGDERPYGDLPEVTNDDVRNATNLRAISRPTAEVIVGTMDVILPLLLSMLIRGGDTDDAKLTDGEHETLVEAWATYLGDKNVEVSPGMALIIAIVTIYGAKAVTIINNRKNQRELEQAHSEVTRLQTLLAEEREKNSRAAQIPTDDENAAT